MTSIKFYVASLIAVVGLLALGGCQNGDMAFATQTNAIKKLAGYETKPPVDLVEPEQPGPPLIVGLGDIRVALPFAGEANGSKSYTAEDGVSITMSNGFVTRATGMGVDLNALYLPSESSWVGNLNEAADSKTTTERTYEYWEKRNLVRDIFRCTLAKKERPGGGSIIDETCQRFYAPENFVNRYWMDDDGEIECSRQWVSWKLPPLQIFRTTEQAISIDLTEKGC